MSEISVSRSQLSSQLWSLKKIIEREQPSEFKHIHFNYLLNDPEYRTNIIEKACISTNKHVREAGLELRRINRDISLTNEAIPHAEPTRVMVNQDIEETVRSSVNKRTENIQPPRPATQRVPEQPTVKYTTLLPLLSLVMVLIGVTFMYQYSAINDLYHSRVRVSEPILHDTLWTADNTYVLEDLIYVDGRATLTIEAGTRIAGTSGSGLVVTRDATIYARGTADAPIVFTSNKPVGQRKAGDWGGVVLLGNALLNTRQARIEGISQQDSRGVFGGSVQDDNCGVLNYVRIEFAGYEVYSNNELNGLTLGGCGNNTVVRNVQIHQALDDGIEVFGGNVDLKKIVVTAAHDDSVDWDMGWNGRVQFLVVQQYKNIGDSAFEGDNNKETPKATPISEPTFYNLSIVSSKSNAKIQRGIVLRRGSAGHFHNMLMMGFTGDAVDLKGPLSAELVDNEQLQITHSLFYDIGRQGVNYFEEESGETDDDNGLSEKRLLNSAEYRNQFDTKPYLTKIENGEIPIFVPNNASAMAQGGKSIPEDEFWDTSAKYIGAFQPGARSTWIDHWTDYPLN